MILASDRFFPPFFLKLSCCAAKNWRAIGQSRKCKDQHKSLILLSVNLPKKGELWILFLVPDSVYVLNVKQTVNKINKHASELGLDPGT